MTIAPSLHRFRSLTPEMIDIQRQMEAHARSYGLDFFNTIFEVVDHDQLSAVAAYGGFPTRYPHWRYGMEYEQLSKSHEYGLSKIYELVINNDPCYAYLIDENFMDRCLSIENLINHQDLFSNRRRPQRPVTASETDEIKTVRLIPTEKTY